MPLKQLFLLLCLGAPRFLYPDATDDRVAVLANDLKIGGATSANACHDLDTIRGVFGSEKIRLALVNMFVGGCSDGLIKSIPLDDDSIWDYMIAIWQGDAGSPKAYGMLAGTQNPPNAHSIGNNVATFLKQYANCPSSYMARFLPPPPLDSDTRDAVWAVLTMPPCPAQGVPSAGAPTVLWVYRTYDDMRAAAGALLGDNLSDLQAFADLARTQSNEMQSAAARVAAVSLTCGRSTHNASDQGAIDKLITSEIEMTESIRSVPAAPGHSPLVYSNVLMLEAIRSCNSSAAPALTSEINSFGGSGDEGIRLLVKSAPSDHCVCFK